MDQTYLWALGIACAAVIVLTRQAITSGILDLDPMQKKLAEGICLASTQGLTAPAVTTFWRASDRLFDRRRVRGLPARRTRIVHALLMCRERLSQTEFEMARRMVRRVYVDI